MWVSTRERIQFPSVLLQPLGHLSGRGPRRASSARWGGAQVESTVYRTAETRSTADCDDCEVSSSNQLASVATSAVRLSLRDRCGRALLVVVLLHCPLSTMARNETKHVLILSSSERPFAPQSDRKSVV